MTPAQISTQYSTPMIFRRMGSSAIDMGLLVVLVYAPPAWVPGSVGQMLVVPAVALAAAYFPLFEGYTGRTIGKWLMRTKVVDAEGRVPGVEKAWVRTLARLLELNPILFGGIPAGMIALYSPTRQRLGDQWAGTYVLRDEDLRLLPLQPARQ